MRGKFGVEADIAIPSYYIKDIVLQSFQLPSILQHLTLKIAKIKQEIENQLNFLLFVSIEQREEIHGYKNWVETLIKMKINKVIIILCWIIRYLCTFYAFRSKLVAIPGFRKSLDGGFVKKFLNKNCCKSLMSHLMVYQQVFLHEPIAPSSCKNKKSGY